MWFMRMCWYNMLVWYVLLHVKSGNKVRGLVHVGGCKYILMYEGQSRSV